MIDLKYRQLKEIGTEGLKHMGYVTSAIALGVVLLFAYGLKYQRREAQRKRKTKADKVYPLSRTKKQSNLRRIK